MNNRIARTAFTVLIGTLFALIIGISSVAAQHKANHPIVYVSVIEVIEAPVPAIDALAPDTDGFEAYVHICSMVPFESKAATIQITLKGAPSTSTLSVDSPQWTASEFCSFDVGYAVPIGYLDEHPSLSNGTTFIVYADGYNDKGVHLFGGNTTFVEGGIFACDLPESICTFPSRGGGLLNP